ncbi:hypothetical protein [Streptomyces sp. NPDC057623]|uniref:hypothetical protein n=1 Tax=Streptomyces sp. NPDC057623 TaxID=3346187 RepID=UPI00367C05AC
MTSDRRGLAAVHLLLVWAMMTAAVPVLGFGVVMASWGGGTGAAVPTLAVGVPLSVGLLSMAGVPARSLVPLCGSVSGRLGWAVMVFVIGTLGVVAGLFAYGGDVDLGSAGTRVALTGVPYAVAAAFFVPSRWVRLGAVAVLAAGVVYGGFVGPAQAQQRRHEAEVARYRERAELLYLGTAPPGMMMNRVVVGPAYFSVEYLPERRDVSGYVGLTARPPLTPTLRCPEFLADRTTCTVDGHGDVRMVSDLSGGTRDITLIRRHRDAEVEVRSQFLDEAGLRRLLDTLHPLSDSELERLMREKMITQGY